MPNHQLGIKLSKVSSGTSKDNTSLKPSFSSGLLSTQVGGCVLYLLHLLMFVTKLVLDPLVETVFAQFLKLSETCWKVMAKINLLLFISRMFSSNFEKIKLTLTKVKALTF